MVSKPIIQYYYTQFVGDATNLPVIKAAPSFTGMAVIDADPYNANGQNWYINQNNFFRAIRNMVIDLTAMPQSAGAGIHWQIGQATSLQNIRFEMVQGGGTANKQQGIFMDNGSGGFMSDLTFNGGNYGMFLGNQQFTTRNLTFNNCNTAIYMNWNWAWTFKSVNINNCHVGLNMSTSPSNQTVGSVLMLDSMFTNTPTGIVTAWSRNSIPIGGGTLVLDNVDFSGSKAAVVGVDGSTVLPGGSVIANWVQGNTYSPTKTVNKRDTKPKIETVTQTVMKTITACQATQGLPSTSNQAPSPAKTVSENTVPAPVPSSTASSNTETAPLPSASDNSDRSLAIPTPSPTGLHSLASTLLTILSGSSTVEVPVPTPSSSTTSQAPPAPGPSSGETSSQAPAPTQVPPPSTSSESQSALPTTSTQVPPPQTSSASTSSTSTQPQSSGSTSSTSTQGQSSGSTSSSSAHPQSTGSGGTGTCGASASVASARVQHALHADSKPSSLLNGGDVFERSKPLYENVPASSFISVKSAGAKGDGVTDDTAAIQKVLDSAQAGQVVYFDHGAYVITSTVKVPKNIKITGEVWPMIMASGAKFANENHPIPALQIGQPGDVGNVEMSDLIVMTKGTVPGAILMEWNVGEASQGSVGMWDVHFRIGGSAGSEMQSNTCPKTPNSITKPKSSCIAAFMLLHITSQASAYIENAWMWTADHDLDIPGQTQINVYTGRGVLIESRNGPVWMWGTASEHHQLYNYQVSNAENVFMGLIQTETPYYQDNPNALVPFTPQTNWNDPDFKSCTTNSCRKAWGLRVMKSSELYIYGAGLYSFFNNYAQTCLNPEDCQENIVEVDCSDVHLYGLSTKASTNMVTSSQGGSLVPEGDNTSNFCSTIALFEQLMS